jgi:hypothetical protein
MKRLFQFALLALLCGIAGQAGAQTVTNVASADVSANTTQSITVSAGVGVGKGVIAVALSGTTSGTLTSCTDNAATPNTYTVDQNGSNTATSDGIQIYSCSAYVATAIPVTTGSVSMTFSNSSARHLSINQVSAFRSGTWVDQNPTGIAVGYTSAQTITAGGADTGTNDAVFVMCGELNNTASITSGYTALESLVQLQSTTRYYYTAWKVLASGTPAATCTLGGNTDLVLFMTSYFTSAAGATTDILGPGATLGPGASFK